MEERQSSTTPGWEAMEVEETGHVAEVLQGVTKISPIHKGDLSQDSFED